MKIRIQGAGFYGCHIACKLIERGHDVEIHESKSEIFNGASGSIPARLHQGFHYPRSFETRAASRSHTREFMRVYGHLTRSVETNIYAIAETDSMVDYRQYVSTLRGEVEFIEIHDPEEFGLAHVEGAVLTGERHIITNDAKQYFYDRLNKHIHYNTVTGEELDSEYDWTIDCTFCANEASGVDRYEPCIVLLLKGEGSRAVTIMDGPFASLYPWNPKKQLFTLSSAKFTPFSKEIKTYGEARQFLDDLGSAEITKQADAMIDAMCCHYPCIKDFYKMAGQMLSIRAMPASGADTRLVDVVEVRDRVLRVRAGKIDAIIHAEQHIRTLIE